MIEYLFSAQRITVGWGKKETQFHGSEGKQAAQVKKEVILNTEYVLVMRNMFMVDFALNDTTFRFAKMSKIHVHAFLWF